MSTETRNSHDDGDLVDVERRRPWAIIAPIVLVLLAVMLVFAVGSNLIGGDDTDDNPQQTPQQGSAAPSGPNDSLCGLQGYKTAGTVTQPPGDAEWVRVGATSIPVSKTAGPGVVERTQVRYCYAHTPEGAVMAALNIYAWGVASTQDTRGVIEHGVVEATRDAALKAAETAGPSQDNGSTQLAGFQVVTYSGSTALVSVALKGTQTGLFAQQTLELSWEDNDWRIRPAPDGSLPPATSLPDLTGYVVWSGV